MNSVPIDFCERVWAICKCCERLHASCSCLKPVYRCKCPKPSFVARQWNQSKEIKQLHLEFLICSVAGKWKYGFRNIIDVTISLDELMKFPNLMNMRVLWISVMEAKLNRVLVNHDVVDVEKLLNFVSCFSNEPALSVQKPQLLDSYEGRAVFNWLQERRFSGLVINPLTPAYYRMLENQKMSTKITVWESAESALFLERRLMSGELRRASLLGDYKFPSAVLKQIVQNVLENPEEYSKNKIDIFAHFDDSTRDWMDEMTEKKLCSAEQEGLVNWTTTQIPYKFDEHKKIRVKNSLSKKDNWWGITSE